MMTELLLRKRSLVASDVCEMHQPSSHRLRAFLPLPRRRRSRWTFKKPSLTWGGYGMDFSTLSALKDIYLSIRRVWLCFDTGAFLFVCCCF